MGEPRFHQRLPLEPARRSGAAALCGGPRRGDPRMAQADQVGGWPPAHLWLFDVHGVQIAQVRCKVDRALEWGWTVNEERQDRIVDLMDITTDTADTVTARDAFVEVLLPSKRETEETIRM